MPNYQYKAINPEGQTLTSVLMAPNLSDVKRQLQDMQMIVISIKEIKSAKTTDHFKLNVKDSLILHFTKQLYTLLKAGVPIISSLRALKEQMQDEGFKQIIETIQHDIEGGSKLSDALAQFPKVFPTIYTNSVKVGEISGTLEETLLYVHDYLDTDSRMKKDVKKAFRYPMFVMIGLVGAFIVFTTTVIPSFLPMFESMGADLPLPTKILVVAHDLIMNYGLFLLLGLGLLIAGIILYIRKPEGKLKFDTLVLQIPILGPFVKKVNVSRFAKLFFTMNKTGINITKAFEIMQGTMENRVFHKEIGIIADKISKGEKIATSISQSPHFTSLLVEMIAIGEKSGSLDDMLFSVSEYYNSEVSDTVANMTSLIEPIVTVLLGGMILVLALAMFMPMWEMMSIM
jgi:type II secretory pathway component PulF